MATAKRFMVAFSPMINATSIAIFPGSFDPITNGHVDVVQRALAIFDKVVVAVLSNPDKKTLLSSDERAELIRSVFAEHGDRVVVETFSGLLVEFAARWQARVIIRGLRAISDYDYEAQMALMNKSLSPRIETLFMITREQNAYISSTLVRQIAKFGGDVSHMVPAEAGRLLKSKI